MDFLDFTHSNKMTNFCKDKCKGLYNAYIILIKKYIIKWTIPVCSKESRCWASWNHDPSYCWGWVCITDPEFKTMKTPLSSVERWSSIVMGSWVSWCGNVPYCHGFIACSVHLFWFLQKWSDTSANQEVLEFSCGSRCTESGWKACTFKIYSRADSATSG